MTQIRIDTERARETGRRLIAEGDRMGEIGHELQRAIGRLDTWAWDGRSRARAEPLLNRVRPESERVKHQLEELGYKLVRVANIFEQEDNTAARNLGGMGWVDWDTSGGAPTAGGTPDDGAPDFDEVDGGEGAAYGPVNGQPFIAGQGDREDVHPSDIEQGQIGDCYLMAALAGIALQNPKVLREMIRDNGNGTYTVTLYKRPSPLSPGFEPVEVVVTPDFPLKDGRPVFAGTGDADGDQKELWPMLIEKAYAQHHRGYDDIEGGWGNIVLEELTGTSSERFSPPDLELDALVDRFEAGEAITVSSLPDRKIELGDWKIWDIPDDLDSNPWYQDGTLVASHEYYVTGIDRETGTVSIRNPWGWEFDEIALPFDDFQDTFQRVSVNPLSP